MTDHAGKAHFRPDIEGLRAVAIIAVLLYHMGVPGTEGGFVGVDVFFVISGFLITSLLRREFLATGRIDLVMFYSRRFRRLLPAALLAIVVTTVVSALVLSRLRFPEVAGDGAAAAVYVSNMRFAMGATDYLASEAAPSPFLHFWSLSVEEQFYFFWPLLVLVTARLFSLRGLAVVLVAMIAGSLWLTQWWTDVSAPWAFFSLPTRAWQLAVGALIAVGVLRLPSRASARVASAVSWIGLALILAAVLTIDGSTAYPGTAALLPVAGTALAIIGGSIPGTRPSRLLSLALPRWIGRISYSLYLWHWPLLILVPIALGTDSLALRTVLAGVAFVFAALSTELVEVPIREGRVLRLSAPQSVTLAGACSVAVAFGAVMAGLAVLGSTTAPPVTASDGPVGARASSSPGSSAAPALSLPPPVTSGPLPPDLQPALGVARKDLPRSYADGCHLDFPTLDPPDCAYGDADSDATVVLVGDSHAAQWLPMLEVLADEQGWRLVSLTKSACPMADVPVWNSSLKREYRECHEWRQRVLDRLAQETPVITFVASADMYELADDAGRRPAGDTTEWRDGLARMLEAAGRSSGRVVLLADTPRVGYDPLECLATQTGIEGCAVPAALMVDRAYAAVEAEAADAAGAQLVPVAEWICPGASCPLVRGSTLVYRDTHHLTATFAALLAGELAARLGLDQGAGSPAAPSPSAVPSPSVSSPSSGSSQSAAP